MNSQCHNRVGIEKGLWTVTASSVFSTGYTVDSSRLNKFVGTGNLEGGWIPNISDEEKWIKVWSNDS